MAEVVAMPRWGMSMETGVVLEWRVAPGDRVEAGDVLASIETEKTEVDLESPVRGVVSKLLVEANTEVPVGTDLLIVEADGEMPNVGSDP